MSQPKKTQWDYKKDKMLIELVKSKPELYDLTSPFYSDNVVKRRDWVEINKQLGCEDKSWKREHLDEHEIESSRLDFPDDADSSLSEGSNSSESESETTIIDDENCDKSGYESSEDETYLQTADTFFPKWRKKTFTLKLGEFKEVVGPSPQLQLPDGEVRPIHIFENFFNREMLELLTYQTNLYATQKQKPYKATSVEELKRLLGILLFCGLSSMPTYRDFWSADSLIRNDVIANAMGRLRFEWLLSHLHVNDNQKALQTGDKDFDKLYKVRPLLDILSSKFMSLYQPTEHQTIDESMIKFKGRSTLKRYIPVKPTKQEYKILVRASSNGYISQFEIYTGKKDTSHSKKCLRECVVLDLTRPLFGKNYKIYAGNYFSSVNLAKKLQENDTGFCGLIREHKKGIPPLVEDKKMSRGDSDFRMDESGISIVKWMDKKSVLVVSNFHDLSREEEITREQKDGLKQSLKCPSSLAACICHMGHVDLANMRKSLYAIDKKSKKWWVRIFFHFLDVSVVNSFVIYNELFPQKKMTLRKFRVQVIHGLLGCRTMNKPSVQNVEKTHKKRFKSMVPKDVRRDQAGHLPLKIQNRRRCNFCSTKAEPHQTQWICETCEVPLCLSGERNCFRSFHRP